MIIHALQTGTPFVYEIFRIGYCIRSKCTSDNSYSNGVPVCKACTIIWQGEPRQVYLPSIPYSLAKRHVAWQHFKVKTVYCKHIFGTAESLPIWSSNSVLLHLIHNFQSYLGFRVHCTVSHLILRLQSLKYKTCFTFQIISILNNFRFWIASHFE